MELWVDLPYSSSQAWLKNFIFIENNWIGRFQYNIGYTYILELSLSVWLVAKLKVEMRTCLTWNMLLIDFSWQLLLFIEYPILLFGFKMGYEVLDLSVLGAIFIKHITDGEFISDYSHECWVDINMVHLEIIFWEWISWWTKDLTSGMALRCLYLIFCGDGKQSSITVDTFLEVKAERGW